MSLNLDFDRLRSLDPNELSEAARLIQEEVNNISDRVERISKQSVLTPLFTRLTRIAIGAQSIANDTDTFLTWATPTSHEDLIQGVNIGGMFNPSNPTIEAATGASQIVFAEPGLYLAMASVHWAANATGDRRVDLRLMGSVGDLLARHRALASGANSTTGVHQFVAALIPWAASGSLWRGSIAVEVYQNSGGPLNVAATSPVSYTHWFMASRVGSMR